ncbi:hypothetical protein [Victivallis sp. Marseille-Q1083]|uniref:hypothetical protein n=1 Tax=Victivallis sp. Marseille-Q1083 TaxID=2717288 RepID=UPI00158BFC83|nr:hypothetical protein [Victivallis sp. Marseille-Q1083]
MGYYWNRQYLKLHDIFRLLQSGVLNGRSLLRAENAPEERPLADGALAELLPAVNQLQWVWFRRLGTYFWSWAFGLAFLILWPLNFYILFHFARGIAVMFHPGSWWLLFVLVEGGVFIGWWYFKLAFYQIIWQMLPPDAGVLPPFWRLALWCIPGWNFFWNFRVVIKPVRILAPPQDAKARRWALVLSWSYCFGALLQLGQYALIILSCFKWQDSRLLILLSLPTLQQLLLLWLMGRTSQFARRTLLQRNNRLAPEGLKPLSAGGQICRQWEAWQRRNKRGRGYGALALALLLPLLLLAGSWGYSRHHFSEAVRRCRALPCPVTEPELEQMIYEASGQHPSYAEAYRQLPPNSQALSQQPLPLLKLSEIPGELQKQWETYLADHETLLQQVSRRIAEEPLPVRRDWLAADNDSATEYGNILKSWIGILNHRARLALEQGDSESAAQDFTAVLQAGNFGTEDWWMAPQLIGMEIENITLNQLHALGAGGWLARFSDSTLFAWQQLLETRDRQRQRGCGLAQQGEIFYAIQCNTSPTAMNREQLPRWMRLHYPADRLICWTDFDFANLLEAHLQLAPYAEADYFAGTAARQNYTAMIEKIYFPHSQYLGKSMMRLLAERAQESTRLRLAATSLAVERYRRKVHRLPATLDVLVPEFLPAVPLDPFSGQPLQYYAGQFKVVLQRANLHRRFRRFAENGKAPARRLPPSRWQLDDQIKPIDGFYLFSGGSGGNTGGLSPVKIEDYRVFAVATTAGTTSDQKTERQSTAARNGGSIL